MIWFFVWLFLMLFWLFGGCYVHYHGPNPNPLGFGAYTLIPWICVLLIGLGVVGAIQFSTDQPRAQPQQVR